MRSLMIAVVVVVALAFPLSAQAQMTEIITGDLTTGPASDPPRPLSFHVGVLGQLQAKLGGPFENVPTAMFFGANAAPATMGNFWHLRVKGAPAPNVTFGPREGGVVAVSNTPVTGDWTAASPARVVTLMNVQHGGVNLFEVRQTVLYVARELRFRVVWQVRNIDPENRTIPFVFGTSADLQIDGVDASRGVFVDGPSRFVGGTVPSTRITGGIQEATSSRLPGEASATPVPRWASYEEGPFFELLARLSGADAFLNTIDPSNIDNAAGVTFADRATTGLAPGQTARYEVIWHYSRPMPLTAAPASASRELPASHTVTLSFVDASFNPVAGQAVRYRRTGVNPTGPQSVTTNAQGLAQVTWAGSTPGADTLLAWIDQNGDSVQDPDEPAASASVRWIADNHLAAAPTVTPPAGATPSVQPNPDNPEAPTYQFGREGTAAAGFAECTFDQRTGRSINLPVAATLQPGGGTISDARLFVLDRTRDRPTDPATPLRGTALADPTAEVRSGNVYAFTVPCVVSGEMWLEFRFTEGGVSQLFTVPIGALQLTDPQGVVYDGARYDAAIADGSTPAQARSIAAIAGATASLQRETLGVFLSVLSGDPGIAPNVNPQTTGSNGLFQWDVSAGTYRVLVSAPGCRDAIGGPVRIPPPALDVHVRMDCGSGGGPGGGAGGGASAGDTTAPVLSRLRLSPRAFRSASAITAAAARSATRRARGSKIRFELSERANVALSILRRTTGRRVGASCKPLTPAARNRRPCTRYAVAGSLRRASLAAGANSIAFSGRLGTRRLATGSYRVLARPVDAAGNRGAQRAATFRIVSR